MVNFLEQAEKNKKIHLSKKQIEIKNIIVFEIELILLLLIQSWFFKVAGGVDTGSQLYDWLIVFLCGFPILGSVILGLLLAVQNFIALYKWKLKYIRIINICSFVMYLSVSIIFFFQHEYRLFWFLVMAYSILAIILALYSIRNKISGNNRVAVLGIIISIFFMVFIVFGAIWGQQHPTISSHEKQLTFLKEHEAEMTQFIKAQNSKIESVQFDWDSAEVGVIGNGTPMGAGRLLTIFGKFNENKDSGFRLDLKIGRKGLPEMESMHLGQPFRIEGEIVYE